MGGDLEGGEVPAWPLGDVAVEAFLAEEGAELALAEEISLHE